MRDEVITLFIDELGEPQHEVAVPESAFDTWRERLPGRLLEYWRGLGWSSFGNGLVWTVDPGDYEDIVDEWLHDTEIEQLDAYHVFARSAFGDLFACGERTGCNLTIACSIHTITGARRAMRKRDSAGLDDSVEAFFATSDSSRFDLRSQEDGQWLFEMARRGLGELDAKTMYGFTPALLAGGRMAVSGLQKVALDQHVSILRQLAPPRVVLV